MNNFKSKEENGACGVREEEDAKSEQSNFELKPKKKDICIHKKAVGSIPNTENSIKEEEV